jgi:tRNA G18 (ribose-2'-O)-methylase SpoU
MSIIPIHDLDDPRIRIYRNIQEAMTTSPSQGFIVESRIAVERALHSPFPLVSILSDDRAIDDLPVNSIENTDVYVVRRELIDDVVGFEFHRGMLAHVLPRPNPPLEQLVANSSSATLVVCPQIADPTNLAGIIRNCAAFGTQGLILGANCANPFSRRVARVSMGNLFRLPIRIAADLKQDLIALRGRWGVELIATVLDSTAEHLAQSNRPARMGLLLGSEGPGLSRPWIQLCDRRVTLPMKRDADSLNVATASGIFLYHFTVACQEGTTT